jgi:hypothetical protein
LRIRILRVEDANDATIMLAQYQLPSIMALEQRLAQYLRGTHFTVDATALHPQTAAATLTELARFAEAQGIERGVADH